MTELKKCNVVTEQETIKTMKYVDIAGMQSKLANTSIYICLIRP